MAYTQRFHPFLAPSWLDFVATLNGFDAPSHADGLAWCDLGCGSAVSATYLAAADAKGRFHGIDLLAMHIRRGEQLKAAAGVSNLKLLAQEFGTAARSRLPRFDYIVAHGVYSWVDPLVQADLRALVARHLKPGGLFYVSYNTMPGWAADATFQHLTYEMARAAPGDSVARFNHAVAQVERLSDAGAIALRATRAADEKFRRRRVHDAQSYFPHEFLVPAWQPLYVTAVRRDMAAIGLTPVGSATLSHNFDNYVLRARARRALRDIVDPDLRELARDYFLRQSFRRDVFARSPRPIDESTQRRRLLESSFDLSRPPELVEFHRATEAGTLRFDSRPARRLVRALEDGPRRLIDLLGVVGGERDTLATALVLCAGNRIVPVNPTPGAVASLNRFVLANLGAPEALAQLAHPHGTGIDVPAALIKSHAKGQKARGDARRWQHYFEKRGMWG